MVLRLTEPTGRDVFQSFEGIIETLHSNGQRLRWLLGKVLHVFDTTRSKEGFELSACGKMMGGKTVFPFNHSGFEVGFLLLTSPSPSNSPHPSVPVCCCMSSNIQRGESGREEDSERPSRSAPGRCPLLHHRPRLPPCREKFEDSFPSLSRYHRHLRSSRRQKIKKKNPKSEGSTVDEEGRRGRKKDDLFLSVAFQLFFASEVPELCSSKSELTFPAKNPDDFSLSYRLLS